VLSVVVDRREAIATIVAAGVALTLGRGDDPPNSPTTRPSAMTIACIIRYQIDPFQRNGFKKHCENLRIFVPRCGAHFIGSFLPYEGTNDVAWNIIAFDSLAAYEAYHTRLRSDAAAVEDAAWMRSQRIILREERNFLELVDGTFNLPSTFKEPMRQP
jgi:hypothetical protein